ncbi:MAG: hypothetical protein Q7T55_13235 [Solirubrobacteraceae bacterium]|nr:hypothetical protein [Solirubrobacteraceae bacterium]
METPEEERHDYDPAPESETPDGGTETSEGNDVPEGLDSQQGDDAGGNAVEVPEEEFEAAGEDG